MKARIPWKPSSAEKKAMMEEINKQTIIADQKHWFDVCALMLYALHIHPATKFGKKRLKNFFFDFDKLHSDLIKYYELNMTDAPWLAHQKLKEIGVDVREWAQIERKKK